MQPIAPAAPVSAVADEIPVIAPEYSTEGVQELDRYIQPSAFRARSEINHFRVVALAQHMVVGMIEMRGPDHVSLLFVAPALKRRGIARELLQ